MQLRRRIVIPLRLAAASALSAYALAWNLFPAPPVALTPPAVQAIRGAMLVGACLLLILHARDWGRFSGSAAVLNSARASDDQAFLPLSTTEARARFVTDGLRVSKELQLGTEAIVSFGEQLINWITTRRVRERVTLDSHTAKHNVSVDLSEVSPANGLAKPVYLLAKRSKAAKFREMSIDNPDGFQTLSFRDTQALLFLTASAFTRTCIRRALTENDQEVIAELITSTTPNVASVNAAFAKLTGRNLEASEASLQDQQLWDVLNSCQRSRPFFVVAQKPQSEPPTLGYSFAERAYAPYGAGSSVWRKFKGWISSQLLSPSDDIEFSLDRSLETESLIFDVHAPGGAYFHAVEVWDMGTRRPIPSMNPDGHYRSFVGSSLSSQATHARVNVSGLSETGVTFPVMVCRLAEIPPGPRGYAALIACASLITIWICGSLYPLGNSNSVDLAAVILTAPGALTALLAARGSLRERTASVASTVIVMAASFLSILALTLYLAFGAGKLSRPSGGNWGEIGTTVAFMDNWLWLCLFVSSLVVAAVAVARLLTCIFRYRHDLEKITLIGAE